MRQKGSTVAFKKEAKRCKDRETWMPFCDSLDIATNLISTKETKEHKRANVYHSFSTKRFYIGKHVGNYL